MARRRDGGHLTSTIGWTLFEIPLVLPADFYDELLGHRPHLLDGDAPDLPSSPDETVRIEFLHFSLEGCRNNDLCLPGSVGRPGE